MPMLPDYGFGDGAMDIVASHQRCLVGSVLRTKGTILELGVGWYSTPILHEIATTTERKLISYENWETWFKHFRYFSGPFHDVRLIGWWGDMPLEDHYGLVFVDQGQPIEREYSIRKLIDRTDVFVMHDTEEHHAYGYHRTIPLFKYTFTDKCQRAWTTVASNVFDVSKWFNELPQHETPSEDIT